MASGTTTATASLPAVHPAAARVTVDSALGQVLQSESVRRLFNQPNIVIHAIPRTNSPTAFRMVRPNSCIDKKSTINDDFQLSNKPELSIRVINSSSEEIKEAENLLPSKNNGKSEILLVPVVRKRKECGHFEPCESLECNVDVQQYEDEEGVTPLISVNISDDKIDADVAKHCANKKCDALSVDHDRCRRALVELYRCDKSNVCDICEIVFQGDNSRLDHKKCRRKNVYQHNTISPSEVFKYRMRQRELQMIEAAKMKRSSDYLDPVIGFTRTMEALSKNDELIIIPKMPPFPPKIVKPCLAPLSSTFNNYNHSNNNINKKNNNYNNNNNNNKNNNIKSILGSKRLQTKDKELTSEMISNIIASCQNSIDLENRNVKNNLLPTKQIKLSDHSSLNGATVNIIDTSSTPHQPCINFTGLANNINVSSISNTSLSKVDEIKSNNTVAVPSKTNALNINSTGLSNVNNPVLIAKQQQQQFIINAGLQLTSVNNAKLLQKQEQEQEQKQEQQQQQEQKQQLQQQKQLVLPANSLKLSSLQPLLANKAETTAKQEEKKPTNTLVLPSQPYKIVPVSSCKTNPPLTQPPQKLPLFRVVPEARATLLNPLTKPTKNQQKKKEVQENVEENGSVDKSANETAAPAPTKPSLPRLLPKLPGTVNSGKYRPLKLVLTTKPREPPVLPNAQSKKPKVRRKRLKKPSKRFKFRCTHCPKRFTSIDYCRVHIARHENDPGFFCRLCERGFLDKQTMKKHAELEHKPNEVRCEMCDSVLPGLPQLAEHVRQTSAGKRQCPECESQLESCNGLDVHMRKQHGFLICGLCKRQVAKSKMKRHLMLEHSLSKYRSEKGFEKLTLRPAEGDLVREELDLKVVEKSPEVKPAGPPVRVSRRSSARRRSSKEFFVCSVCERRFDSEKQFQIHLANNPMKFTSCPECSKKFHRKAEYTEHSKTCNMDLVSGYIKAERTSKKRKSNLSNDAFAYNSDHFILQNSIDEKCNDLSETDVCKKIKIDDKVVQTKNEVVQENDLFEQFEEFIDDEVGENGGEGEEDEEDDEGRDEEDGEGANIEDYDYEEEMKNEYEEDIISLKSNAETKLVNGFEKNASDCLDTLNVIEIENVQDEINDIIEDNDEGASLLNNKQSQMNSDETTVLDKSVTLSNIFQEHNYQVLQ